MAGFQDLHVPLIRAERTGVFAIWRHVSGGIGGCRLWARHPAVSTYVPYIPTGSQYGRVLEWYGWVETHVGVDSWGWCSFPRIPTCSDGPSFLTMSHLTPAFSHTPTVPIPSHPIPIITSQSVGRSTRPKKEKKRKETNKQSETQPYLPNCRADSNIPARLTWRDTLLIPSSPPLRSHPIQPSLSPTRSHSPNDDDKL
ncbi:hypothetical protein BU24DRAFT_227717 [Aaosphaeria arxii CBS 175.79]|uniref:Uncharacterized protein n=1 Tax=Aaosphaeria arxii CBS 175.79 TaxID=1450172 RepID=A0A6A5XP87_9PLEO|nr:uncharacterized protein BU24DRAFT_227717 [Aaosphaeria arxii CBS 175.79]KAF2015058.1 hypothetical protein BU24DRAFT_227717 [Aaosphaeria arxii CBS 175.79]